MGRITAGIQIVVAIAGWIIVGFVINRAIAGLMALAAR